MKNSVVRAKKQKVYRKKRPRVRTSVVESTIRPPLSQPHVEVWRRLTQLCIIHFNSGEYTILFIFRENRKIPANISVHTVIQYSVQCTCMSKQKDLSLSENSALSNIVCSQHPETSQSLVIQFKQSENKWHGGGKTTCTLWLGILSSAKPQFPPPIYSGSQVSQLWCNMASFRIMLWIFNCQATSGQLQSWSDVLSNHF